MEEFRVIPPPWASSSEIELVDDIFIRQSKLFVQDYLNNLGYVVEGGYHVTTGRDLKIVRCNIRSRFDADEFGILVYWQYPSRARETSIYIGERLEAPGLR